MHKIILNLGLITTTLLLSLSCSSDDDSDFGFIDQDLTGMIEGQEYVASKNGGKAEVWVFDDSRSDVTIGGAAISDPCQFDHQGPTVSFIIEKKVGVYHLDEDWVSDVSVGQILVYFHPEGDNNNDNFRIISDGTIEITAVDDSAITGRLNARLDDNNFANGNFSISYCQE